MVKMVKLTQVESLNDVSVWLNPYQVQGVMPLNAPMISGRQLADSTPQRSKVEVASGRAYVVREPPEHVVQLLDEALNSN